ncbi:MAG TPA: transposase [Acidobacteriaceae bacterium]|nr:transposase [Acidobacteriaceae bacterium]
MATIRQKLSTYAVTISTFQQHRHFQKTANAELFIATLFRYRDQKKFLLHGFAVMPDHVHILITPAIDQSTARCIQLIKGGYSHARHSPTPIWHSGHHDHRIRDEADFAAQLNYIANNPSRKNYLDYPHVHTSFLHLIDPAIDAFNYTPSP